MSDGERRYSTYILNDRVGIYVIGYPVITRHRSPDQPRRARDARWASPMSRCCVWPGWSPPSAGTTAASGRAPAARSARQLLSKAVSRVPRGGGRAGAWSWPSPRARSSPISFERASNPTPSAWRPSRSASSRSTSRSRQREAGAAPDDDIMVWLSRAIAAGRQHLPRSASCWRRASATCSRRASCRAHPGPRVPRDRARSPVEPRRAGDRGRQSARPGGRAGARSATGAPFSRCRSRCGSRRSTGRSTRSIAVCCWRRCCSRCSAPASATTWPSGSAIPVNRLTRATRRIARGDFSARVVETSIGRAATAGRRLQSDGGRPRSASGTSSSGRTGSKPGPRWPRQVAHEIKNPLTPIQLSSEHLVRVNKDGANR